MTVTENWVYGHLSKKYDQLHLLNNGNKVQYIYSKQAGVRFLNLPSCMSCGSLYFIN
jgi:hypothetical protein